MNNTPNINLSTYTSDPNDKFNLLVTFNNNMNKIDTAVGSQNDAIEVIEETASTAVTTANTASTTANTALTTANSKASINDNMSSLTLTYSSNKINSLIAGIQPGTEIDDTTTSTTKTWSSSKINSEITALTQIHSSVIQNPDTNKFSYWSCRYAHKGNILYISGAFRLNQAPTQRYNDVFDLPENVKFYDGGSGYPYINTGYITKAGDTSYLKTDVIFEAVSGGIRMFFPDTINYSQLDSNYTYNYSLTLISDN